ncbi:MAG: SRPBCC family protein [Actinomycetes bacterium]
MSAQSQTGTSPDDVSRSTFVAAPPEVVWALVSDLPGMGRFSPENRGGRWVGGATGPAVGAVFRGRNESGWRRWGTRAEVVECEVGRRFTFDVRASGLAVSRWRYDVEPADGGCRLTETWTDCRGALMRVIGRVVSGVADRRGFAARSIEHTLERVKAAAETGGAAVP